MSRDSAYLRDILKAAPLAMSFVEGKDKEAFERDAADQSAVIYQLMVVGEATKRLSESIRETHSQVPWRQAARMRDVLIHDYDGVDLDEVWHTLTVDIPALIRQVESLVTRS